MSRNADSEQEAKAPLLFLSHAGEEREAARALAAVLRGAGVEVWLDIERLKPGDRWQDEIGAALRRSRALILYVGREGVARWVDFEVQIALDRAAKDAGFRLIPVLGPGADPDALPDFVKLFHWLDLRNDGQPAPEKLKDLLAGVLNKPAERIAVLPPDRPPFRGLLPFDVEDAVVFFGRERETEELLGHLGKDPFLLVLGDSGCGKSSLVRAGLVPSLLRGRFHDGRAWVSDWRIAITRPGNDPFGELAESLPDLANEVSDRPERIHANRRLLAQGTDGLRDIIAGSVSPGARTLLVVDQFEELFTLTTDATVRGRYIDCLLRAANAEGSRPIHVVVTLRADFFGRCWDSPDLLDRVRKNQYLTPRLSVDRLRDLIERPLALAGAKAEPGLIETMLDDIGDEPGNLALLEHALDQLWQKRRVDGEGLWITHEAYEEMGRLAGALRNHANAAMERLKDDEERNLARRFFVDLTQLGEGTEDTRRRVKIEDLAGTAGDWKKAIAVLEKVASERLITTGDDHAEVAHEELIRNWPELRTWVDADRDFVRRERRFLDDAREWQRLGRDSEVLLRGARLLEAEAWLASASRNVPSSVRELVEASVAERKREEDERERRRQEEVARLRKTRTVAVTAAAVFVVLAIGLAYYWWSAQEAAHTAFASKMSAEAHRYELENPQLSETRARFAVESARWQWLPENERLLMSLEALGRRISLKEHGSGVTSVAFSPKGRWVASGSNDKTVRVWEAATGKEIARLEHGAGVSSVAFSPHGKWVASGSKDKTVRVWEAATGKEIVRFEHRSSVVSVAFLQDGKRVVSGSEDRTARVWNVAAGKEIARIEHGGPVLAVAVSPDGKSVVSGSSDKTARVWEAATGKEIARAEHWEGVVSVAFSPDGLWVVSGGMRGPAQVWKAATGEKVAQFEDRAGASALAFSPDGQRIASGGYSGAVWIWDAATGEGIRNIEHEAGVALLAFSPDGQRMAGGSPDGTARVWNVTGGEIVRVEHDQRVTSMAFSPDGKRIVSGSRDGTARVWEAEPRMRHDLPINSMAFSPDGKRIVSGSSDYTARVWEVATGKEIRRVAHMMPVDSVAFSPDGRLIVSGSDRTVRVWGSETGKDIARWEHSSEINSVSFSPDSKRVLIGSRDRFVRVLDLATGKVISPFKHEGGVMSVAFSPEGQRVVSGSWDDTARVWDLRKKNEIARFFHAGLVRSAVFSPDGKQVVSGGLDGTVRVWEVVTGRQLAQFGHGSYVAVVSVAFSPDGKRVASGNWDHTARVWDLATRKEVARVGREDKVTSVAFSPDGRWLATASWTSVELHALQPDDLLKQICSRLWRNFTQEEWQRYLPGEPYRKTCPNLPAGK